SLARRGRAGLCAGVPAGAFGRARCDFAALAFGRRDGAPPGAVQFSEPAGRCDGGGLAVQIFCRPLHIRVGALLMIVLYNPWSTPSNKKPLPMSLLAVASKLEGEFDYEIVD